MNNERVYWDVTRLTSPVGDFIITNNHGDRIMFHVERISDYTYSLYDEKGEECGELKNDDIYEIVIPVKNLVVGEIYEVIFKGKNFNDTVSDEHTYGKMGMIDNFAIGIGAYDPNDELKFEQDYQYSKQKGFLDQNRIVQKEEYDKSNFNWYELKDDDINGFSFQLLDCSRDYIYFTVAWLQDDIPFAEDAVDYWIT